MRRPVINVAVLLFGSGFCALVYQTVWLRELRLVFGGSTAASAAVLAIFLGGLGLGSSVLGRRADRHPRPLVFYGNLELAISVLAASSPALIIVARQIYIALGGTLVLGRPLATLLRLVLSSLILGAPTFLMGGTLPAAARTVETRDDAGRRRVALLYGFNTLGAVTGVMVATFAMLELYGNRRTLFLACAVNGIVGITARSLARRIDETAVRSPSAGARRDESSVSAEQAGAEVSAVPSLVTLVIAGAAGFVFLLMELIWYRMLAPLLGGSTFTFGLILALALLGIGLGGTVYGLTRRRSATLGALAFTLVLEGLFMAIPYALGDRVAALAELLRPLGALGFGGLVASWSFVALLVVFPTAFVSGYQFPLLIGLLGRGRERVGRHVGQAYAWNTVGSIVGSLAGGFGLLPLLSATGCWVLVAALLAFLGLAAALLARRLETDVAPARFAVAGAIATIVLLFSSLGPTAAWRQSPVGAGRVHLPVYSPNELRAWMYDARTGTAWQRDGVESCVAIRNTEGVAFLINGKVDGHSFGDAGTQVMGGLLGALLHPDPRRAMVIGLGTGSTAGWLAAVPSMERVDVVEIEPAVVAVAQACTPVNRDVLVNRKTKLIFADARETLLTTPQRYDVIFSEPSNPYRAGVAGLFTREFYTAAGDRLEDDGVFLQWLQAYEIDERTVRTVLVTMQSVFDHVEIWQTLPEDLLLVASKHPLQIDASRLGRQVLEEPYRSAMVVAWRNEGLEGLLAHFVAGEGVARRFLDNRVARVNTDDLNRVEFDFARTLGRERLDAIEPLRRFARQVGQARPEGLEAAVDWERVGDSRVSFHTASRQPSPADPQATPEQAMRLHAHRLYLAGEAEAAAQTWLSQTKPAKGPMELVLVADGLARLGDAGAEDWIDALRRYRPSDADALMARLRLSQNRLDEAALYVERTTAGMRQSPWTFESIALGALATALDVARTRPELAPRMSAALAAPFAVYQVDLQRRLTRIRITRLFSDQEAARQIEDLEPWVPWNGRFLTERARLYAATGHRLAAKAQNQLRSYLRYDAAGFDAFDTP